ncbi:PREDICTED: multidrug resistance-associated protein 4-like [Acropora digitifera]|uniref:multidrug resistance-associated protein 4-like n=1 Tax=Acropora digitifera TaxID=70779 RepID=UPI00077A1685|nr:PREDICTED: multidrug resistance-associated protein 4-like [Acropora digitifera]
MPAYERFDKLRREEPSSFLQQEEVGLWSLLLFDWMSETFKTGASPQLQQSDLLPIEKQNRTKVLSEKFQQLWNDEQNACVKSGKQPRLWRCVVKMLRKEEILIITIFSMVHKIGSTLRCLLLGFILYDLISNTGDKTMTYTCAVLLGVVSMGERLASHSQRWMSEVFAAIIFPDIWLSILSRKTLEQQQRVDNIVIYAGVTAAALVFTTIRVFLFFIVSLKSSQRLHDRMVQATLHAQLSFFDTNPAGRILNRFSRDVASMDEQLPQKFILCIQDILFVILAVLIPAISNPWLFLVFFPTVVAFLLLGRYYLKTSRELKRLESICRSPVYSHFTETMAGLETIRTRRMQKKFMEEFYRHQDLHNQAIYMVFGSTRWFGLRVDLLCVPFLTCVALASVAFSMDPGK